MAMGKIGFPEWKRERNLVTLSFSHDLYLTSGGYEKQVFIEYHYCVHGSVRGKHFLVCSFVMLEKKYFSRQKHIFQHIVFLRALDQMLTCVKH